MPIGYVHLVIPMVTQPLKQHKKFKFGGFIAKSLMNIRTQARTQPTSAKSLPLHNPFVAGV